LNGVNEKNICNKLIIKIINKKCIIFFLTEAFSEACRIDLNTIPNDFAIPNDFQMILNIKA
jgi:hypothetical protein